MGTNQLREVREREGLSRAALSRAAGLNEKTLQRAEAGESVSTVTQNKIVKALNKLPDRLMSYSVNELFADDGVNGDSESAMRPEAT